MIRAIAVRLVAFARDEPRPDRHVAGVLADERQKARELGDRMLAVGVNPAGKRIPMLCCVAPARGDTGFEPAILGKAHHYGAALAPHLASSVG